MIGRLRYWASLAVTAGLCWTSECSAQSTPDYHLEADQALQSFLIQFWNGGQQYLRNKVPDDGTLTGYWTFANGWQALLDGVERTGKQRYSGLIESFYLGQDAHGWSSAYYDDECWMIMALVRAYDLTANPKYLAQAESIFSDVKMAWDTSCCGAAKGGLWWDKAHTLKATASNAGGALSAAMLFRRNSSAADLNFAKMAYSYWYSHMVNASTFQVADHLQPDGTKVWWKFTYNEGLMIGASVELSLALGDKSYLTNAYRIANFMISNEVTPTKFGSVLFDGLDANCNGDCAQFKAPAYRNLMRLYALDPSKTQYYRVLKAGADAIWNLARNTNSDLFASNWAGPPESGAEQSQDNSGAAALNIFAEEFSPYPGTGASTNQYEAEDATLHHIGLEAIYGHFTGWAYLAAWNSDGQSVDFAVTAPATGAYKLIFRYAAAAGAASRQISINGADAVSNQNFPATTGWDAYNTVTVSHNLNEGNNTVSIAYASALGSKNWLNLDNLVVVPPPPPGPLLAHIQEQNAVLSWSGPGVLQSAPEASGPWTDVSGNPTSPVTIQPNALGATWRQFYRLRE